MLGGYIIYFLLHRTPVFTLLLQYLKRPCSIFSIKSLVLSLVGYLSICLTQRHECHFLSTHIYCSIFFFSFQELGFFSLNWPSTSENGLHYGLEKEQYTSIICCQRKTSYIYIGLHTCTYVYISTHGHQKQ
jgi:hypothetical protein